MNDAYDLLFTGGTVVTGSGMRRADVGVRGETIAAAPAGGQVADAADEHEGEREVRGENGRDVQVHDALHVALDGLARGVQEGGAEAGDEPGDGQAAERPRDGGVHDPSQVSRMNSKVSRPMTT